MSGHVTLISLFCYVVQSKLQLFDHHCTTKYTTNVDHLLAITVNMATQLRRGSVRGIVLVCCLHYLLMYVDANLSNNHQEWFSYLSKRMAIPLTNSENSMLKVFRDLEKELSNLRDDCSIDLESQLLIGKHIHLDVPETHSYGPCGSIQIDERITGMANVWYVTVNHLFRVLLHFLRFEMDDSGTDCGYSSLDLAEHNASSWMSIPHWKYCGHRKP